MNNLQNGGIRMKKTIILFVIVFSAFFSVSYAQYRDVDQSAQYSEAVNHISQLGIMNGVSSVRFSPDTSATREQFAKIVVGIAGLEEDSSGYKNISLFPDVAPNKWSSQYISLAVKNGFIKGMLDGNFHPSETVNFAQACTVFVRVLGYSDEDIPGVWPQNYISKAKDLKISENLNFLEYDDLPRWAIALMANRTLNTSTKNSANQTLAEASGLYLKSIILGNSKTMNKLTSNQIYTSRGILYTTDETKNLSLAHTYGLVIEDDKIVNAIPFNADIMQVTVLSTIENRILYSDNDSNKEMYLPDKTTYYYQGATKSYDSIPEILKLNSSIVFYSAKDSAGYNYAVVFDPVQSHPELGKSYDPGKNSFRKISISQNEKILKNGEIINIDSIEGTDVIYEVSDIWGNNKYISVSDNTVEGLITKISPNRQNVKSIEIDGTSYEISPYINLSKISISSGLINNNKNITALLDSDNKIIDIEDNLENHAIIINTSEEISVNSDSFEERVDKVKLFLSNGLESWYNVHGDYSRQKGNLVTYKILEDDYVEISRIDYPTYNDTYFNRETSQIDSNYVSDDFKILNILSIPKSSDDAKVQIISLQDVPQRTIEGKKIKYLSKSEPFGEYNFAVINDALDTKKMLVYADGISSFRSRGGGDVVTYSLITKDKNFTYSVYTSDDPQRLSLNAYMISLSDENTVEKIISVDPIETAQQIQNISRNRIKINGSVYRLKDNLSIITKNKNFTATSIGIGNILLNHNYTKVSIYLDKPVNENGKVEMIIIEE